MILTIDVRLDDEGEDLCAALLYAPASSRRTFHAATEVYPDGHWHLLDAAGMASPGTIARIGVGRDAADIPFLLAYGKTALKNQKVSVTVE